MARNYRFFLDNRQGNSRKTVGELKARCQTDNPGTDNCDANLRRNGDCLTVFLVIVEMSTPCDLNSQVAISTGNFLPTSIGDVFEWVNIGSLIERGRYRFSDPKLIGT
jgi:hypothetical protein